jgi:hypothetical protein
LPWFAGTCIAFEPARWELILCGHPL